MPKYVVSLTYKVSLAVDRHLDAHVAWLKDGYERGVLLASGRKEPRTGGVLLASGDRRALDDLLSEDPFRREGIADYEVTEVTFSMSAAGLEALRT